MTWCQFERSALASATLEITSQLRGLVRDADVRNRLRTEISLYDRWRRDPERHIRFQRAAPVPGARPADYRLKRISTPAGQLLVGIRFQGGDLHAPFVQIYARDFALEGCSDLRASLHVVLAAFLSFKAERVRVRAPVGHTFGRDIHETVDFLTLAGRRQDMAVQGAPFRGVSVHQARAAGLFAFYAEAYRQHHAQALQPAAAVEPLDRGEFAGALQKGEVYEILQDRALAGLLVARPAYRDGMRGYLLVDEVIAPFFRARGLAAVAQRLLAAQLREPRRDIIFGTIAPENKSSLRTATNAGRIAVSKCSFLVPA